MPLPVQRIAILGFQRTGTNFLVSTLDSLPEVTFHPEPFNPNAVHLASGRRDVLKDRRDADPQAFLDRLVGECPTPILGVKLLPNHAPAVRARIIADPAWQCIVLFRPNFLAVHASLLRANQTGVWAQTDSRPTAEASGLLTFEPRRFLSARDAYRGFYDEVTTALDAAGKAFLPLNYIDLLDPLMLRNVARHIGARNLQGMSSRLVKQGGWDVAGAFANRELVIDTLAAIGRPHWVVEGGEGLAEALREGAAVA